VNEPSKSIHDNVNGERNRHDSHRSRSADGLTSDQAAQLIDAINGKRRSAGASNMNLVRWNEKVAALAQTWSERCLFEHGSMPYNVENVNHLLTIGANMWASGGSFDVNNIINSWYNDQADFDPETQRCGFNQPCGAYEQMLNAETTDVGCGMTLCPSMAGGSNQNFLVCYFGPAGNSVNEGRFQLGSPCTMCTSGKFYCNNGLCDNTCTSAGPNCECKAECKNCGTATSDCTCQCKPGSVGVNCADECMDYNPKCHRYTNGWWPEMCIDALSYVKYECPLMCKLCVPGTPCGKDEDVDAVDDNPFIR